MKKNILALVLAAGLTSFAGTAKATVVTGYEQFSFSITGLSSLGSSTGTLEGILTLNADNTAATSLILTNIPADINISQPDVYNTRIRANSFSVDANGNLTNYFFSANDANYNFFHLELGSQCGFVPRYAPYNVTLLNTYATFTQLNTVPEPSTYALFGLGALALVVAYRRKVA